MTTSPEPAMPRPDSNRSHQVQELIDTTIPQLRSWTWMSEELQVQLHGAFEATRAAAMMNLLRQGLITPEQAQEVTPAQLFIAAFDLGLTVGEQLEKTNAFRRMMGEDV